LSFFFYAVCTLGVVLGGVVLLVLYSLLVMAHKGEECLDQLELEMLNTYNQTQLLKKSEKSKKRCAPPISDLYHGGTT